MNEHILLEKLRNLLQTMPPLEGAGSYTNEQFSWIGKANAVMSQWSKSRSIFFKVATDSLLRNNDRKGEYGLVVAYIYEAIAQLENSLPQNEGQAFGPCAAYDFFKALNSLVESTESSILIIDPYLDAEVFDGYLHGLKRGCSVRLIVTKNANAVLLASKKYATQSGCTVEIRLSSDIHDRIIFVDDSQCWALGASIKDAAMKKPTYLAPISQDIAIEKRKHYEHIWASSKPI